ncbi:SRPBCC domain-containing protein [Frankia gtarii]|uniref:SRPBCC domain-containing protein n=1 Tax=Frankia gtarii TaxID=2950102 RepID=UPI0021C06118|nr:SRPBCC domain-containing protein [Frankia gtarii]
MTIDRPSRATADSAIVAAEAGSPLVHGSCTLSRDLAVPPGRVFAAFSDLALRQRWFRIPSEPGTAHHELDFRVSGCEIARGTFAPSGVPEQIEYRSEFLDIVPDERIVFTYTIMLDGHRRSVSLVTVELAAEGSGTRVTRTEQYVFLVLTGDGQVDVAHLEGSMRLQFNGLESAVVRS